MKSAKVTHKAFFGFLAMSVFMLSVFCCCLADVSHAKQEAAAASVPECHRQAASEETPSHEECDCPQIISTALQKSDVNIQLIQSDIFKLEDVFVSNLSAQDVLGSQAGLLVYHSPPQKFKDTTPLYLKNSILRL